MLRARDPETIEQALDKLKNRHNQQITLFHKLEILRDKLLLEGDDAIAQVLEHYSQADRQQLRSLVRNAQKEQATNKPPKTAHQLYQYLLTLIETD